MGATANIPVINTQHRQAALPTPKDRGGLTSGPASEREKPRQSTFVEPESMSLEALSSATYRALTTYPYYTVVDGLPPLRDEDKLIALGRAIKAKISPPSPTNREDIGEVSFTRVFVDRQPKEAEARGVTQFSRTDLRLPPHTDSSYMALPHEVVVFHCVEADARGGKTVMVPVDDVLKHLEPNTIERLKDPVYPFGKQERRAILCQREHSQTDDWRIRYYCAQVKKALETEAVSLSAEHQFALEALDALLDKTELFHQFHLQPGQTVFMHNQKVLHGRTALSPGTNRLLYRLRLHVGHLDGGGEIASAHSWQEHLALAADLEEMGRIESAIAQYRQANKQLTTAQAAAQNSENFLEERLELLSAQGYLLLETGKFEAAADVFRQCVALDPYDYESSLALSSLARIAGDKETAIAVLKPVMQANPFVREEDTYSPHNPDILRLRGVEGAAYSILGHGDGTYSYMLRGGHFSTRDFISEDDYNVTLFNIFENNVDSILEHPSEQIPDFGLILNTIACPDAKVASLLSAARFVDRYPHIPVINQPRKVLETTRDRNSLRINTLPGVTFPKTEKLWWDGHSIEQLTANIRGWGFVFPLIVRKVGSQTGKSVALLQDECDLRQHFLESPADQAYYVIQFQDCSRRRNVYHKMRVFFIDGVFYPVANVFNNTWNTHSSDRYSVMDKTPWMWEEEKAFLSDPVGYLGSENFNRLHSIRDIVDLDFFGIDFTVMPDRTLFVFEANAAMRHNFDHANNFPHTRPHLETISKAFDQMVQARLQRVKNR